jgi:ABC-2 type transport system ATP-binding protein
MLVVENLRKDYKNITAVNNISFEVKEGKIFGMLGPNGAGKTTTIRTVLNIIKPTSGKILFDGLSIPRDFFNNVGYLPEERGLYRKSKVFDTILYFAELKNLKHEHASEEAINWLKKLDIISYKEKKIEELSKGNQQKIQFIISIIHNPKLLILDEPFSGFDPINQQIIEEVILSFVNSGKIIILSTHQMEIAEKLCSDIFLMDKGKEVLSGQLSVIKKKFGKNHLKIIFEGESEIIRTHSSVTHFEKFNGHYELQLAENINPAEFLRSITDKVQITHFSVIEPTLYKIFIDAIKGNLN